ncbi:MULTISPECIES: helix-turn-helix domain-containing protein [Mycobacterium]|uniref:helix-turn-helix domain-containing protein n=1 Tax=Mycobacterium TaxID=1763 RepID=UPI00109EB87C|nr:MULTISPECIES: helix-turn-helix domain-containing protein [Mycobacterium]
MSESLAWVVGANCRRIRTRIGVTQEDLARYAKSLGLKWTASKVGDFEAGRYAPTFATVLVVLLALNLIASDSGEGDETDASGFTLADLFGGNGLVALTDRLDVPGEHLADVCRGKNFTEIGQRKTYGFTRLRNQGPLRHDEIRAAAEGLVKLAKDMQPVVDGVADVLQRSGLTERRLAKQLDMSDQDLAAHSFGLWQSTFSDERDKRAGPDANRQKKGRITRELRVELERELADGND